MVLYTVGNIWTNISHSCYWLLKKYFRASVHVTSSTHLEQTVGWSDPAAVNEKHATFQLKAKWKRGHLAPDPSSSQSQLWSDLCKEMIYSNSTQDSEIHLLEEAKRCRAELERLQAQEVRAEERSSPEEPESEVNELRRQLLGAYDELKAAEDRDFKTQHKLKWFVNATHIITINT